ncbi:hypothetical protein [Corallococcus sp. 4LFB]|uniref:hypothetical protein n=1 Tax=Corallococcus sp. 4LFB TaxID=3383249 RepID=UPI0039757A29
MGLRPLRGAPGRPRRGRAEGGLLGPAPGIPVRIIGQLADQNPNGVSQMELGFVEQPRPTNRQAAVIAAGPPGRCSSRSSR